MIYQGKPCLPYFSSVVKNVANSNLQIKKLVYIYLLHYAESDQDLALLSVNAIQKSLTDQNPQVRAMALRTMSGMRVPVISQIVALAIKRGCADSNPYVRKAAALAIPKCYRLDPTTLPQLVDHLSTLLGDRQYSVVGPANSAFLEVCPDRIDLLHKHFRSIVRKLVDMDEWSQLATLQLLTKYARWCFPRRTKPPTGSEKTGFWEGEAEADARVADEVDQDPDLQLLLTSCKALLQSKNSAVIIAVVSCFRYLGASNQLRDAVGPLIALLRAGPDIQHVALNNVIAIALMSPGLFVEHASHFLVRISDPPDVWQLKLELLTIIYPHCGIYLKNVVLSELEHFTQVSTPNIVRDSVRAIGRCAQKDLHTANQCFTILLRQISTNQHNAHLVSEALTVIRYLIQQNPSAHETTIVRLAKNLDMTASPEARANIIWLVGEFAGIHPENNIAADVLRILTGGFADESEAAKQQILLLAAKVYLHHLNCQESPTANVEDSKTHFEPVSEDLAENSSSQTRLEVDTTQPEASTTDDQDRHPIPILWRHILLLTRYDTSYDLRDRARTYKALLDDPQSTQLASLVLLAPKPVPSVPSPSESRRGLVLGSMTLAIGQESTGPSGLKGYADWELPNWVEEGQEPDPKLREEEVSDISSGIGTELGGVIGNHSSASGFARSGRTAAGSMLDEALRRDPYRKTDLSGVDNPTAASEATSSFATGAPQLGAAAKEKHLDDWLDESDDDGGGGEEADEETETETEVESDSETESVSGSDSGSSSDEEEDDEDEERELIATKSSR